MKLEKSICETLIMVDKGLDALNKASEKTEIPVSEYIENQNMIFTIEDSMQDIDRFFARLPAIKKTYDTTVEKYGLIIGKLTKKSDDEIEEVDTEEDVPDRFEGLTGISGDEPEDVEIITNEESDK